MKQYILTATILLAMIFLSGCTSDVSGSTTIDVSQKVKVGDTVQVDYWLTVDGKLFQTTEGNTPLIFTTGVNAVLKDFEDAVIGMQVGETKEFVIPKERAYPAGKLKGKDLNFKIKLVKIE